MAAILPRRPSNFGAMASYKIICGFEMAPNQVNKTTNNRWCRIENGHLNVWQVPKVVHPLNRYVLVHCNIIRSVYMQNAFLGDKRNRIPDSLIIKTPSISSSLSLVSHITRITHCGRFAGFVIGRERPILLISFSDTPLAARQCAQC